MSYKRLRIVVIVALLAEFVLGLGGVLTARGEIFPFASWFLFSLVPYHTSEYDLLMHSPGDNPNAPSASLSQAGDLVHNSHSIVTFQLIQQLGRAVADHREQESLRLREQIEAQFKAADIRYDLVRITYAPVPRWTTGRVIESKAIQSFRAGNPAPIGGK